MLALADAGERSYLVWWIKTGGLVGLLIPVLGLAIFVGAIYVVAMHRRPAVIASYLAIVPLPLLLAPVGALKALLVWCSVIAMSDVTPSANYWASGMSAILIPVIEGTLATIPSYLVVAIGLFVRTLRAGSKTDG